MGLRLPGLSGQVSAPRTEIGWDENCGADQEARRTQPYDAGECERALKVWLLASCGFPVNEKILQHRCTKTKEETANSSLCRGPQLA